MDWTVYDKLSHTNNGNPKLPPRPKGLGFLELAYMMGTPEHGHCWQPLHLCRSLFLPIYDSALPGNRAEASPFDSVLDYET